MKGITHFHIEEKTLVYNHENKNELYVKEFIFCEMWCESFDKKLDYFNNDWILDNDIARGIIFEGKFVEGFGFFLENKEYGYEQIESYQDNTEIFENLEDAKKSWNEIKTNPQDY